MFAVYILKSEKFDRYYIGSTGNIKDRLRRHNEGREKYTKKYAPWELKYKKYFNTRSEAVRFENHIKEQKDRSYIENLILEEKAGL
ncbi:GIY-YIG nuclease family protein [Candidatus Dojkabacteria bacterium]|nr:GIY-YIG nuclease family protein [Candidatus Dojkabacteria bacterium]